jgi:hypothetical protein
LFEGIIEARNCAGFDCVGRRQEELFKMEHPSVLRFDKRLESPELSEDLRYSGFTLSTTAICVPF